MIDKQKQIEQQARALHAEWVQSIGAGPVSADSAAVVLRDIAARCAELADALTRQAISVEQHNDARQAMVLAMRRLMDSGTDERASRMLAREMHDLFADAPPLPHPKYRFTFDWVAPHAEALERDLARFRNAPGVRALEIGCFEGQSACWYLDNILTHPTSRLVCVDPFAIPMGSVLVRYFERLFDYNIAASGSGDRVTKLVGRSQDVLPVLPQSQFDFIYVDGSHKVGDVLQDAVLTWPLLRAGGLMIFDDYDLCDDAAPGLLARAPGRAIDAFAALLGSSAATIRKDWQFVLQKV
ncbi:MAG TPA: class I SAM-dependent methyltransferase [Thermoanaerobaculia bacterium]|nr:class I SAM-dependent methyltransferase [Thermoanaerobaculia bacterium]